MKYDWQRYWSKRGDDETVRFDPSGFLLDPAGGFWSSLGTGLSTLPELAKIHCLALIGEPGIGKSTALKDERDRLRATGQCAVYHDLRSISDAAGLREKLAAFKERIAKPSDGIPILLLDSLDECRIEVNAAFEMIVEALESMRQSPPRLLVCCRSADWPQSFEAQLAGLYGAAGVGVYVLAPLRRCDVDAALNAEYVDSGAFFDEIFRQRLVPLAIKPLTLNFLLAEFRATGRMGSDQAATIERGCLALCEESQIRRDSPNRHGYLTARRRLELAKRIAATTLFTGREFISTVSSGGSESTVTLDDVGEPTASRNDVLETLKTGLFVARGPSNHGWYHKLPEEFLAARFLAEKNIPLDQLRSLMIKGSRIVPQLREAAAWLAQTHPQFFRLILNTDPGALVAADAQLASDDARREVVASLLRCFAEGRHGSLDGEIVDGFSKLANPSLDQQLDAALTVSSAPNSLYEAALLIALRCRAAGIANRAADIALEPARPLALRRYAAALVAAVGNDSEKLRLRPLASAPPDQSDDDLKASALTALWPSHLRATDLFAALTPPRESAVGGAYHRFLRELPDKMQDGDCLPALNWVASLSSSNISCTALEEVARAILARALNCAGGPEVLQALAGAAIARVRQGDDLRPCFEGSSTDARLDLLEACLDRLHGSELQEFYSAHAAGLGAADVPGGLLRARQTDSAALKSALGTSMLFVPGAAAQNLDAFADAAEQDPILRVVFIPIVGPIPLSSPTADHYRSEYKFEIARTRQDAERAEVMRRRVQNAIEQLRAAATGNADAWWQFTFLLSAVHDGRLDEQAMDLTNMAGWMHLAEADIADVKAASRTYLENAPDDFCRFAHGSERPGVAGARALRFLAGAEPDWLENLQPVHWARWAGAIARAPLYQDEESCEEWARIRRLAWRRAEAALIAEIGRTLADAANDPGAFYRLRRWAGFWSPAMEAMLLEAAENPDLNGPQLYEILTRLCACESADGVRVACTQLRPRNRTSRCHRAAAAACALLHGPLDSSWPAIARAMRSDADFGRIFVEQWAMEAISGHAGTSLAMRLKPSEIAELFVWLARNYLYSGSSPRVGAIGGDFAAERLRDHALQTLRQKAAVEEIRWIRRRLRSLTWLAPIEEEAILERLRRLWHPPSPVDLERLLTDSNKRLVRNGQELQELVLRSLNEIGADLQGEHAGVHSLWNTARDQKPTWKSEPEMSAYIAQQLQLRLCNTGVAVNREIEIKPARNRTDIQVTATSLQGGLPTAIKVTIEAKGSWNPKLESSMREQLLRQYLDGTTCSEGIYLVYWVGRGAPIADLRGQLDAEASRLTTATKSIKAVALDCSLPDKRRPPKRRAAGGDRC